MRNFQTKQNVGALADTINIERFGAGEFNALAVENEAAVSSSGQTLAPADGTAEVTDQLGKALAIYGAGGAEFHLDTGAVNAYVLNPISPRKSPNVYFDGFTVSFEPGNVSTGAATVNVASLGVKSILSLAGAALTGGEITGAVTIRYSAALTHFVITVSGASTTAGLYDAYLKYTDTKTAATEGGTATLGSWETRDITTEDDDPVGIGSLSANRITLPAGTFKISASVPGYNVGGHVGRLQDITGAATLLIGTASNSDSGGGPDTTRSVVGGRFTLGVSSALEIQHRVTATKATNGHGVAINFGVVEIYTLIEIWREI